MCIYISFSTTLSEVIYFFKKFISISNVGKAQGWCVCGGVRGKKSFSAIAALIICVSKKCNMWL